MANELTRRCGLADRARFLTANALDLPFDDASFQRHRLHPARRDQHRRRGAALYAEVARVLRPGAGVVIYDILRGPGGPVQYPTPWSSDGSTSFLVDRAALEAPCCATPGFAVEEAHDRRAESLAWFEARAAAAAAQRRPAAAERPPAARADCSPEAFANLVVNLREERAIPTYLRAIRAVSHLPRRSRSPAGRSTPAGRSVNRLASSRSTSLAAGLALAHRVDQLGAGLGQGVGLGVAVQGTGRR